MHKQKYRGFTLIELLLVMGIVGVLSAIVIVAINPGKQFESARGAERQHNVNELEKAMYQYLIAQWELLSETSISEGEENAKPICKEGVTTNPSCVNIDALVPDYIALIPTDEAETNPDFTGYKVYKQAGRPRMVATYVGGGDGSPTDYLAYWKFDEAVGATSFSDASTNGNDGSCSGTTCPTAGVAGRIGTALQFDGSNDYVALGVVSILRIAGPVTIAGWVKRASHNETGVMVRQGLGADLQYAVLIKTNGGVLFQWHDGSFRSETTVSGLVAQDVWTHVAVTRDDVNTITFYIDGIFQNAENGTATTKAGGQFNIGSSRTTGTFNDYKGLFDDIRIYNRALTATEIATLASGG